MLVLCGGQALWTFTVLRSLHGGTHGSQRHLPSLFSAHDTDSEHHPCRRLRRLHVQWGIQPVQALAAASFERLSKLKDLACPALA